MSGYIGATPVPQATQHREAFTATASQTSFATVGYTPQFVDVYLNGVKLAAADYTATNGSDIVLTTGAALNDILEYVAYTPFEVADQTFTGTTTTDVLTTTGAFTSLGIDDNAAATAVTIDASGNVLVGKTSASNTTAGTQIEPNGLIRMNRDGGEPLIIRRNTDNGDVILLRRDSTTVGSISVTASATAYNTSSDYRLKKNITPVQGAADIVKAMQPVTYTFKSDGSWHDGFLAHELQELHPRAVIGSKDAVDEEGNPEYQGVDYSKLTPILTAALQEALNKIDALEAQNAAFETRLAALEATP